MAAVNVGVSGERVNYILVKVQVTDEQWNDYLRPLLEAGRQHVKFDDPQQKAHALSFAANLISGADRVIYDAKEEYL